jgi:hypothetical protein
MTEAFDTDYQFHLEANRYWAQARKAFREKRQDLEVIQLWEKGVEAEQASPRSKLCPLPVSWLNIKLCTLPRRR